MKYTTERMNDIKEEIKNTEFLCDVWTENDFEAMDFEDFDDGDDVREYIFDRIAEHEVIYYHKAIEVLKEHDASLMESLSLASDCGYTPENLNSEILATLLVQDGARIELNDLNLEDEG